MAQIVKNLFAMWETRVRSLAQEDLLEKGMATHSTILENSMNRGVWWVHSMGLQRGGHNSGVGGVKETKSKETERNNQAI